MTFQWRKWMDQWIKETTPSKTWGKTRRDGWEEAITHMPHATNHSESLCESLFFIQPNFTAAFSCSSLHTDWHEQNCPSVLQMVQLLLYSCHTDSVLTLAAWNTGSSESVLEHLALVWSEKQGFLPISDVIYLKHMHWTQEISAALYSLIKALPKKSACMCCSVC